MTDDSGLTRSEASDAFCSFIREQMIRLRRSIDGAQDVGALVECRKSLRDLELKLRDATTYLALYDQKSTANMLKELGERIESRQEIVQPKPKFSFRKRGISHPSSTKSPVQTTPSSTETGLERQKQEFGEVPDSSVAIRNKIHEYIRLDEHVTPNLDVLVQDCQGCIIDLVSSSKLLIATIHLTNLSQCLVRCPRVSSSVFLESVSDCFLILQCQQFRMHKSVDTTCLLTIPSHPIIEDCTRIQFGDASSHLDNDDAGSKNMFAQVHDFNWLRQGPSPNFHVVDGETTKEHVETLSHLSDVKAWLKIRAG